MKTLISTALLAALCTAGVPALAVQDDAKTATQKKDATLAQQGMPMSKNAGMTMDMKAMDVNSDGMVSKDEFMSYHEGMYEKMKKGQNGMVSIKDMEMMHGDAMKK